MYLVFQLPAPKKYLGAELDVAPLAQVFDDTSATYKYWWLSALLQLHHDKMVKTLTAKPRPEPLLKLAGHPQILIGSENLLQILQEQRRLGQKIDLPATVQTPITFLQAVCLMIAKAWHAH